MNWQNNMISGKQRTGNWRNDSITDKQKEMIKAICDALSFFKYDDRFTGTTKGEACDFISKHKQILNEYNELEGLEYAIQHDLENAGDRGTF